MTTIIAIVILLINYYLHGYFSFLLYNDTRTLRLIKLDIYQILLITIKIRYINSITEFFLLFKV